MQAVSSAGIARSAYSLPDFDVRFDFEPTDFTQVNVAINRVLVRRAIGLLDPRPAIAIADFFCGLGQFHAADRAPRRRRRSASKEVLRWCARAKRMPRRNGLAERARFVVANLFDATAESIAALGALDKALVDPPREGAIELVKSLPEPASRASSTSRAIPRRSPATPRCSSTSAASHCVRPGSPTCSRTPRTSSRSRFSSADCT